MNTLSQTPQSLSKNKIKTKTNNISSYNKHENSLISIGKSLYNTSKCSYCTIILNKTIDFIGKLKKIHDFSNFSNEISKFEKIFIGINKEFHITNSNHKQTIKENENENGRSIAYKTISNKEEKPVQKLKSKSKSNEKQKKSVNFSYFPSKESIKKTRNRVDKLINNNKNYIYSLINYSQNSRNTKQKYVHNKNLTTYSSILINNKVKVKDEVKIKAKDKENKNFICKTESNLKKMSISKSNPKKIYKKDQSHQLSQGQGQGYKQNHINKIKNLSTSNQKTRPIDVNNYNTISKVTSNPVNSIVNIENNVDIINKIKGYIDEECQGFINFSYDEYYNLTSQRL